MILLSARPFVKGKLDENGSPFLPTAKEKSTAPFPAETQDGAGKAQKYNLAHVLFRKENIDGMSFVYQPGQER